MDDFNNFFDNPEEQPSPRTPIYHTPDPPRRASKANVALVISIIIAIVMTLVVIVNVILLATLKDSVAKEYADNISRQTYDQYSEAVRDALNGTDIITDVTNSAAQSVIDAMKETVGEIAYDMIAGVARIYMYENRTDSKASGMATAFLITDADEADPERYLVTNAHCVRYPAKRTTSGGLFGAVQTKYVWANFEKILAVFNGDDSRYELAIVACGSYNDENLAADNTQPDLALLKIKGSKQPSNEAHPSLKLASSDYSKPGTPIALIGNPEGIGASNSITTGCISQTGIEIDSWGPGTFILTDAALNSGNSGGPMLNKSGIVVGVAESKLVEESIDNMGFALSATTLCEFIKWAESTAHITVNCRYV